MNNNLDEDFKADKKKRKGKRIIRLNQLALVVGILIALVVLGQEAYMKTAPAEADMTYKEFMGHIENSDIAYVDITKTQETFNVTLKDGQTYSVINPGHDDFKLNLLENGVEIKVRKQTMPESIRNILGTLPMLVLIVILAFYISKTMVTGTKTLFRVLKPDEIVKFSDVAGMSESKKEVMFAVKQIMHSKELASVGAIPTRGIILEGPTGTGKTLLAKAIAGEADVPFISTSGADFIEMFVGLGAARVRALWELAETNAPCVLFIDEIDALGRRRSGGGDGASIESNQTLNALLQKMDGVGSNSGIFVIAATNRISDLDPALLRPGRFDKQLFIGPPKSKEDRDEIINVHLINKKLAENLTIDSISKFMFGMTGAEIAQVLNESVLLSILNNRNGIITAEDVDQASMKLRASGVATTHNSDEDKEAVAIHEAGHAIMSSLLGRKVTKISIIPYSSGVGGVTIQDTDQLEGKSLRTSKDLEDDIKILLAGKAAERLLLGFESTGASNDLEKASLIAYNYVIQYGMHPENMINTDVISRQHNILIDNRINIDRANKLIMNAFEEVLKALQQKQVELSRLKQELLDKETILDYNIH